MSLGLSVLAGCFLLSALIHLKAASVAGTAKQGNIEQTTTPKFFTVLDKEPKRDLNSDAVYKSKVYIVLKNESGKHFDLVYATWEPGDIGLPFARQLWQLEGSGGYQARSWKPEESKDLQNVRPGQVLCTWVPVNPSETEAAVRRHSVQGKLGCLLVSFQNSGRVETQKIQL